jgi:hypothetical protein
MKSRSWLSDWFLGDFQGAVPTPDTRGLEAPAGALADAKTHEGVNASLTFCMASGSGGSARRANSLQIDTNVPK